MAPNRKHVATIELPVDAIEHLRNAIQPKFLPLTDPREQQQQQHESQAQVQQHCDYASYWDWTADTQAEEEEPSKEHLFSTARIEANLIQDAKRIAEASPSDLVAAHDDYWCEEHAEPEEDSPSQTKPQHDEYWHMPANRIEFRQQVAERRTSSNQIQASLQAASAQSVTPSRTHAANDSYWMWSVERSQRQDIQHDDDYWQWNTLSNEKEKQQELISNILEYERARQLLTADHIEKKLVEGFCPTTMKNTVLSAAPSQDTGYWDM
jgi:hypothetical protein